MNPPRPDWTTANQRWLAAGFARLKLRLCGGTEEALTAADAEIEAARAELDAPPALEALASRLGLSAFESGLLMLCAGTEMDAEIARLVAQAQGRPGASSPGFGLALGLLDEPHWSALTPQAPLRRYRMIEPESGLPLSLAPLRLDERVLHLLAGINALDARLQPLLTRVAPPALMSPAQVLTVQRIVDHWERRGSLSGIVLLHGEDASGQEDVAAQAAGLQQRHLFLIRQEDLPRNPIELDAFIGLWEREARLLPAVLLVRCADAAPDAAVQSLAERLDAPLVLALRDAVALRRPASLYEVPRPALDEQKRLWQQALGARATSVNGALDGVAATFRLDARGILAAAAQVEDDGSDLHESLWAACRAQARRRLDDLATRIEPRAHWDDLVLPELPLQMLQQMSAQLRHRHRVYEDWGFAARSARGLGMAALFCGESGTGKTLAAEVLARELALDLYRIDLSAVVSKYIGETEKNLRRVFDAAEDSGAILLFDEADALFGKRSEVRDSHDRYANIEVGYLLTRMEAYRGLAILTTNLRSSLDTAFLRRLRFVVNFPFPDQVHRERIWRGSFPQHTPTRELDFTKLARLHMAGGAIRNIALNAAFLAAESGSAIGMAELLRAARGESAKLERTLVEAETRGWV